MISDSTIQNIKLSPPVEAFFRSQGIKLHGTGRRRTCRCPFHVEKTGSFSIDMATGLYKCFGCGASGDLIKAVSALTGRDFVQAVEYICSLAGIPCVRVDEEAPSTEEELFRASLMAVASEIRRVGGEGLFARVQVGANMAEHLERLQIGGSDREYLVIRGQSGTPVAIAGRRPDAAPGPKWINSSFQKGNHLYGYWETMRKPGPLFVVEGYGDAAAMAKHGYAVCAIMGTAMTPAQAAILAQDHRKPVIMMDGDNAGQEAAVKIAEQLMALHMDFSVHTLPDGVDPAECLASTGRLDGACLHWPEFLAPRYKTRLAAEIAGAGKPVIAPPMLRRAVAALFAEEGDPILAKQVVKMQPRTYKTVALPDIKYTFYDRLSAEDGSEALRIAHQLGEAYLIQEGMKD